MYDRDKYIHFGPTNQPKIDVTGKKLVETRKEEEEKEAKIHDAHNELIENRFIQFVKKFIGLIFVFFKKIFYF